MAGKCHAIMKKVPRHEIIFILFSYLDTFILFLVKVSILLTFVQKKQMFWNL